MDKSTDPYHIPTDPQALLAGAVQGAARQHAQVPELIVYWRHVVAINRRNLWKDDGRDSFKDFCAKSLRLKDHDYVVRCMSIARLDPQRFYGCALPVGALTRAANALGEEAQQALADATRGGSRRECHNVIEAIDKVSKLDDAAAAMYLRAWLIEGKAMVFSTEEPSGEPPPPPSATSLCRRITAAAQLQRSLTLQLCDAVTAGDRPAPTAACEMRAEIKDQERTSPVLLTVVPEPKRGRPTKGEEERRRSAAANERRRQGRPVCGSSDDGGGATGSAAMGAEAGPAPVPAAAPAAAPTPTVEQTPVVAQTPVVDPVVAQTSMVDPVIAPVATPPQVVEPLVASPPVAEPAVAQTPVVEPAAALSPAVNPAVAQTPVAEPVAEPATAAPATPDPATSEPAAAPPASEPAAEPPTVDPPTPPTPALPPSARRPEGWGRDEIHFPVPYPFNVRDLTPLDIIAAGIITLASVASKAAQAAREARRRGIDRAEDVHILLAAYVVRAFGQLKAQGGELRQHLSDFANDGRAKLEPLYRALAASLAAPVGPKPPHAAGALLYQRALAGHDPGAPVPKPTHDPEGWAPVWPVQPLPHWELDADTRAPLPPGVPALTWVKAQCGERLRITEPTEADAPLWRFLGLADALSAEIKRYYATLESLDEPSLDDLLACQLSEALSDVNYQGLLLYRTLEELAQEGEKQEAVITAVAAARQADADHNLIVLGEARRPKLYFKIGADSRGRIIALSAQTPQHIPVIGCTGCGKTHFTRVAAEACCMDLPGLSTLSEQVRVILMEMDFNKGFTRRQMLAGYQPNTDAAELEYLYRMYGYRARGNEAYTRGKLLVLPDSVERLKIELAPLVERGLQIHPCVVHPSEVGMVGYRAMLANLRHVGGSRRAGYMRTIEAVISSLGDEATPENLIEKIPTLKLHGREQEGMLWQLTELQRLLSQDGSRLIDHLNDPSPVFVLLESRHRSPDVLIPYQMVVLGALSGPLRDGSNPLRVVQIDEGNKISENEVAVEVMTEGGRERRHNPRTLILNGQSILGMDADFFSQATVVLVFRLNSMKDVRALKERFAPFMDVPDEDFLNLADGECLIGATRSTSGERVFRVRIRPTVTNAGGETLQAE